MEIKKMKFEVVKHPDYRTINVNGVCGGHRPGFFEIIIYTDELIPEEALASIDFDKSKIKLKRTLQCRLILDPMQAKSFLNWLARHVAQYEQKFGKILMPEEKEERDRYVA